MSATTTPFNLRRFAWRGLGHYWQLHASVAASVAVATAILTGALLVGDSVRDSLRRLVAERLGRIEYLLVSDHFFRVELARELAKQPGFHDTFQDAVGFTLLPSITLETKRVPADSSRDGSSPTRSATQRLRGVQLVACDRDFWELDQVGIRPQRVPAGREVVLNARAARDLHVQVGDRLILRLPSFASAPAESPFGHRDSGVETLADLEVLEILPDQGLASFQIHPSQQSPRNVYLPLETFRRALGGRPTINAIAVSVRRGAPSRRSSSADLNALLKPTLADQGVELKRVRATFVPSDPPPSSEVTARTIATQTAWEYWNLSTDRLVWSEASVEKVMAALAPFSPQMASTYLANRMEKISSASLDTADVTPAASPSRMVPYSMLSAIEPHSTLGPLRSDAGDPLMPLRSDEIVLNSWAAEQLEVQPGDRVRVTLFEPETTHGDPREVSATLRVNTVLPLGEPSPSNRGKGSVQFTTPPTVANDPDLTPTVDGVTDRESIEDWDPPFPFHQEWITPADDAYWERHRTTPKGFVSWEAGKRLWGSRYGFATSIRVPVTAKVTESDLITRVTSALDEMRAASGLVFRPIHAEAMRAAKGTTPFEFLFLGFSFFLILSGLMLIALLAGLSMQVRQSTWGLLLALGWTIKAIRRIALMEFLVVVLVGSGVGVLCGIGYAAIMVHGLSTWWRAAVVESFVELSVPLRTLAIGGMAGILVSIGIIWRTTLRWRQMTPRGLLTGQASSIPSEWKGAQRRPFSWRADLVETWMPAITLVGAIVLACVAWQLSGEAQAGAFLGSGFLALLGGLGGLSLLWNRGKRGSPKSSHAKSTPIAFSPSTWSWRSCARNRSRSLLIAGLIASASFLILAIGAFRLDPSSAGSGRFALLAESDRPLFVDWKSRNEPYGVLGFSASAGDDASCRNLFQVGRPRLIGVRKDSLPTLLEPNRFAFSPPVRAPATENSPWARLFIPGADKAIPVILDRNTALYSLHVPAKVGGTFTLRLDDQKSTSFRIVGLLVNSIFQGNLLVAHPKLLETEPSIAGDRLFLIDTRDSSAAEIASALETEFSDQGLDVQSTLDVLRDLLSIQNTYLSTFQSLGGLGLVLGTIGLATVLLRSVAERKRELGLLAAIGFADRRLRYFVLLEHIMLLVTGLALGIGAALVTTVPQSMAAATQFPWRTILGLVISTMLIALLATTLAIRAISTRSLVKTLLEE